MHVKGSNSGETQVFMNTYLDLLHLQNTAL